MSQNPKSPETFANRVAQFQKDEQKKSSGGFSVGTIAPVAAEETPNQNPYIQARIKVLSGYSKDRLEIIRQCEQSGKLNTREYDRFIFDVLISAGDIPTHTLRKNTEECGCFSCRGKKKK